MDRWHTYSTDPNTQELYALRRHALEHARTGKLVADRVDYLCKMADGKSVLDIGVVEHTIEAALSPEWLHGHLVRHASHCVGVDVLETGVMELRAKGYNVLCADITACPLQERFDMIIGGEVLEHIDSPGRFMAHCAQMLSEGGRLVITVPNPWFANVVVKAVFRGMCFVDSADHVAWYDASVLYELGQRHGLRLESFSGIGGSTPNTIWGRLFFAMRPLLASCGARSELFAKSIIYEFVHC